MPSGRYTLDALLAHGGMGSVYRAQLEDSERFVKRVAIKLLRSDVAEPEELGRRLRDEARLLGLLDHPAIVGVDGLIRIDGRWGVVMELVEGLDLRQLAPMIELPVGVVLEILELLADALDHAATARAPGGQALQLQHRDLKPSNIMLTRHGQAKLLDFGVAKARFDGRESATQTIQLGTLDYMAPERLAGRESGAPADIYSLGVVIWEILGARSFGQSSPGLGEHRDKLDQAIQQLRSLRPECPHELERLLQAMLAWDPLDRPSASEIVGHAVRLVHDVGGMPLRAWCRSELRPLRVPTLEPDAMVGRVVDVACAGPPPEDRSAWDDSTAVALPGISVRTGPSPRDGAVVPPEDEPLEQAHPITRPPPGQAPASRGGQRGLLVVLALAITGFVGGVVAYLGVNSPAPVDDGIVPEPAPERVETLPSAAPMPSPEPPPQRAPSPVDPPVATPAPEAAAVWGQPAPPGTAQQQPSAPQQPVIWGRSEPLEGATGPVELQPSRVWGGRDDGLATAGWTDGVRVSHSGDGAEIMLVDDERGFPVPGVVPPGSWFVRVRFDAAAPVVAGVVEIEPGGPVTLRCDASLSWCSAKRD
jgi:serine/threonine protein kinase